MKFLSDDDKRGLIGAEMLAETPLPTQMVSSDEYAPVPQTRAQAEAEARLYGLADAIAPKLGLSRRRFFQTAAGMAAGFVALNETFGTVFDASRAEAQTPDMADARADALADQFIMDMHTHFLRDDTRLLGFVRMREAVGRTGWNPDLGGEQTIEHLKFDNYRREIFFDSDTKVALISSAPSDIPEDWFLTNEQMAQARARVNDEAGSRRLMTHAIFTPGAPGWLEHLDASLALRPDSVKGYTVGDNTHKASARHPWRMDDEDVAYRGYERMAAAGVRTVCVHKGLWPPAMDERFPHLAPYADVRDVAKAARDWPQLNFIIYHSAYRLGDPAEALAEFERTGRIAWVSDLADIPAHHGVANVYADLGQIFAQTLIAEPRVCAAIMGILVKGLGADHVCWGTDAVWTGAPQWQIEGLRRLEIPEDMQTAHGFAPLGAADGDVKRMIFGANNARLYGWSEEDQNGWRGDALTAAKAAHREAGFGRSNLRYGYAARG
ncbi:MAG: amidohydrolase family protein [Alphaproteobacteria bacterium]|nr:amidohydrolase family protein [Alphaproteobacteria bacterium]